MKIQLSLLLLAAIPVAAFASAMRDGGTIENSRSTNTAPYTIKVWSNGHAVLIRQGSADKPFAIDASLALQFLDQAKGARNDPGTPQHCMKSASFGTTTTVTYHGWQSPDLQCPPFSNAVSMLATTVRTIQTAANVGPPSSRMPLPVEQRRFPPTPDASMTPSSESEHPRP